MISTPKIARRRERVIVAMQQRLKLTTILRDAQTLANPSLFTLGAEPSDTDGVTIGQRFGLSHEVLNDTAQRAPHGARAVENEDVVDGLALADDRLDRVNCNLNQIKRIFNFQVSHLSPSGSLIGVVSGSGYLIPQNGQNVGTNIGGFLPLPVRRSVAMAGFVLPVVKLVKTRK
jgi:hypothetical protein